MTDGSTSSPTLVQVWIYRPTIKCRETRRPYLTRRHVGQIEVIAAIFEAFLFLRDNSTNCRRHPGEDKKKKKRRTDDLGREAVVAKPLATIIQEVPHFALKRRESFDDLELFQSLLTESPPSPGDYKKNCASVRCDREHRVLKRHFRNYKTGK